MARCCYMCLAGPFVDFQIWSFFHLAPSFFLSCLPVVLIEPAFLPPTDFSPSVLFFSFSNLFFKYLPILLLRSANMNHSEI